MGGEKSRSTGTNSNDMTTAALNRGPWVKVWDDRLPVIDNGPCPQTVTKSVTGIGLISFAPLNVTIDVVNRGPSDCLTGITVKQYDANHPNASNPLKTGHWWEITAADCTGGFDVNLTLPADFTADDKDKVCRYTGSGQVWDCAMTSFTGSSITRNGVTAFSQWAAGNNAGPTAVTLRDFRAAPGFDLAAWLRNLLRR